MGSDESFSSESGRNNKHRSPSPSQYRAQMKGVAVPATSSSPVPFALQVPHQPSSVDNTTLHQAASVSKPGLRKIPISSSGSSNNTTQETTKIHISSNNTPSTPEIWNTKRLSKTGSQRELWGGTESGGTSAKSSTHQEAKGKLDQNFPSEKEPQQTHMHNIEPEGARMEPPDNQPQQQPNRRQTMQVSASAAKGPSPTPSTNSQSSSTGRRRQTLATMRPSYRSAVHGKSSDTTNEEDNSPSKKKKKRPPGYIEKDGTPYWMRKLKKKIAKGKIVPTVSGGNNDNRSAEMEGPRMLQPTPPPASMRAPSPQAQQPVWAAPQLRPTGRADALLTGQDTKSGDAAATTPYPQQREQQQEEQPPHQQPATTWLEHQSVPDMPPPMVRASSPWEQMKQEQEQQRQSPWEQMHQQQKQMQKKQVVAEPLPPPQQQPAYRSASPVRSATPPPLPPKALGTPPLAQRKTLRSASPPVRSASPPVWASGEIKLRSTPTSSPVASKQKPPTRPPSWVASPVTLKKTGNIDKVQQGLDIPSLAAPDGYEKYVPQPFESATQQLVQDMQKVPLKHVATQQQGRIIPPPQQSQPTQQQVSRSMPPPAPKPVTRRANTPTPPLPPPLDTIGGNYDDDMSCSGVSGVSALTEAVVLDMTAFKSQQQQPAPMTDLSEHSSSAATAPSWASGNVKLKATGKTRELWKDEPSSDPAEEQIKSIPVVETTTTKTTTRPKKDYTVTTTITVTTTSNKPEGLISSKECAIPAAAKADAGTAPAWAGKLKPTGHADSVMRGTDIKSDSDNESVSKRRPSWQRAISPPNSDDTPFDEARDIASVVGLSPKPHVSMTPPRPPRGRTATSRSMPKPPIAAKSQRASSLEPAQQQHSKPRSSSLVERPKGKATGHADALSRGIVTPPRTTAHLEVVPPTKEEENSIRAVPLWAAGRPSLKATGHADDVLNGVDIKSRSAFSPALTPRSTALQHSLNQLKSPTLDDSSHHSIVENHSVPASPAPPSPYRVALRSTSNAGAVKKGIDITKPELYESEKEAFLETLATNRSVLRPVSKTDRDLPSDEEPVSLKKVPTGHEAERVPPPQTTLPFSELVLTGSAKIEHGAEGSKNIVVSGSASFDPPQRKPSFLDATKTEEGMYSSAPVDIEQEGSTVEVSLSQEPTKAQPPTAEEVKKEMALGVMSAPTMETDATSPTKDSTSAEYQEPPPAQMQPPHKSATTPDVETPEASAESESEDAELVITNRDPPGPAPASPARVKEAESSPVFADRATDSPPPLLTSRAPWATASVPEPWNPRSYAEVAAVKGFLSDDPPPVDALASPVRQEIYHGDKPDPGSDESPVYKTRSVSSAARQENYFSAPESPQPVDPPEDDQVPPDQGFEVPLPEAMDTATALDIPVATEDTSRSLTARAAFEMKPDSMEFSLVINAPEREADVEVAKSLATDTDERESEQLQIAGGRGREAAKNDKPDPYDDLKSQATGLTVPSTHDESTAASQRHPFPIPEDLPVEGVSRSPSRSPKRRSEGEDSVGIAPRSPRTQPNYAQVVRSPSPKRSAPKRPETDEAEGVAKPRPRSTTRPPLEEDDLLSLDVQEEALQSIPRSPKKTFAEATKSPVPHSPPKPVMVSKSIPVSPGVDSIDEVDDSVMVDSASGLMSLSEAPVGVKAASTIRTKSPMREERHASPIHSKSQPHLPMEQADSHSITSRPEEDHAHSSSTPVVDKLPTNEEVATTAAPVVPVEEEKPVMVQRLKPRHCNQCNADEEADGSSKFKYCGKCRLVKYCSRRCQKKNWKSHKIECCKQIQQEMYGA